MLKTIFHELKRHAPYTVAGAATGIIVMLLCRRLPREMSHQLFYVFHPLHVFLSALATAAMYNLHQCRAFGPDCLRGKCNFWKLLAVGYFGSVGIATLSDCLIPYLAESLLNMPGREIHLGFIEKGWLVNPLAVLGILAAYNFRSTHAPHALHVLLSTWASLFHMMMAMDKGSLDPVFLLSIWGFLFLAVWIPCCVSDIIFPLLFVKQTQKTVTAA